MIIQQLSEEFSRGLQLKFNITVDKKTTWKRQDQDIGYCNIIVYTEKVIFEYKENE